MVVLSIPRREPPQLPNPPALKFKNVNWTQCCRVSKENADSDTEEKSLRRVELRVVNLQNSLQFICIIFLPREFLPSFLASYVYTDVIGDFKI